MAQAKLRIRFRRIVVAAAATGWLYAGQLGSWTNEQNRYHAFWDRFDAAALALGWLITSLAIFLLAEAIDRYGSSYLRKIGRYLFLLFTADAIASWGVSTFVGVGFTSKWDWVFWIGWGFIAVLLVPLGRLLWKPTLLFLQITSPLPVLVLVQAFLWPAFVTPSDAPLYTVRQVPAEPITTFDQRKKPNEGTPPELETAPPVFVFVFDEWSYERTFADGDFLPELTHLHALASRCDVYHQALSPGNETLISLPRLLYAQTDGELVPSHGKLVWHKGEKNRSPTELPLFCDELCARGYTVKVAGFYHPYPLLLKGRPIEAVAFPNDPKAPGLVPRSLEYLVYNGRFRTDPLSRELYRRIYARYFSSRWAALQAAIRREAFAALDAPAKQITFVHWPLPHGPFIFDPDGTYRGPYDPIRDTMYGTPDDYHRHLLFLDHTIGEIVDRLHRSGAFDRSLLVMTSDHSWRRDPDPQRDEASRNHRHVPLLIKHPGQTERHDIDAPLVVNLKKILHETIVEPSAENPPEPKVSRRSP
ncbi:MAG: hypothetical protein D6741_03235 [Planctomycetota bacterium]|nr:MAG: hypothetical protein D6741_03235 [Planctomycetota bacterium]